MVHGKVARVSHERIAVSAVWFPGCRVFVRGLGKEEPSDCLELGIQCGLGLELKEQSQESKPCRSKRTLQV